ncbi:MAG TPA: MFS transporter [Dehalococcoidia bacterium]|nr:MFS transporter [Dehalococcoidia bacterium]
MAVEPQDIRLLANYSFRRLLESRAVGQIAQNALLYTLLILVVKETDSSIQITFLVVAWSLPAIVFGIPAGALAEVLPRRPLLVVGYLLRAAAVAAMLYYRHDLWRLYVLLAGFSSVGQLTGPAESAALPGMVRPGQVTAANSFFVFSVMLGQIAGAVVLAPIVLKTTSEEVVLVTAAALFLLAAFLVAGVRGLQRPLDPALRRPPAPGLGQAIAQGWRVLRTSRPAYMAAVYLTISGTLIKSLAVLAPHYTRDVLSIAAENTVYVVAPAAIGAVVALLATPLFARFLGASRTAAIGFLFLLIGLGALGLVVYVRDFLQENVDLGLSFVEKEVGVSSVITVAMIIAIPVGFASTVVGVAGRATLNQEAPEGTQARVFATQTALSDAIALVPLFIIGGVADLVGVRATLLASAVAGLLAALYLGFSRRFGPPAQPSERPTDSG